MASTNKTPNFDLSQYIGSDKPTYLGDYNSDMSKIDTAMATNKTNSENAVTVATGANETASNAQTIATQAQTTAQQANTLAQTAKSAADTAQASANQANQGLTNFNLTQHSTINTGNVISGGGSLSTSTTNLYLDTNANKTIGKFYGAFNINNITSNNVQVKFSNQPIYIEETFTIACVGLCYSLINGNPTSYAIKPVNATFTKNTSVPNNTDITLSMTPDNSTTGSGNGLRIILFPCLYFFNDFGNTEIDN